MEPLQQKLESQLAALPVTVALALPGGRRIGPADAAVRLQFEDWSGLATLAAGQIGKVGEDYVEERVRIEGSMRDLMTAAAAILPGTPTIPDQIVANRKPYFDTLDAADTAWGGTGSVGIEGPAVTVT